MYATVGRAHPSVEDPATKVPVPNELRPISNEELTNPPGYLPQPRDSLQPPPEFHMGPIGPWATGRVNWGPLSGLTGIRPVVDKYSIHRYSETDWKYHNKELLQMVNKEQQGASLIDWNGRQCLQQAFAYVDKVQEDNTKRLNQRELEIHRWKSELERAITAITEEINFIIEERQRLKEASKVLTVPELIASECLERRTCRMDVELVRDEVEEEVIKEFALCSQIRDIFSSTLKNVEKQLTENKNAKQHLEFDWSDKKVAHEIDTVNMELSNRSTLPVFKFGSVYYPRDQTTPEFWEHFTRETLLEAEATRQRSATLRGTLDSILINAARDLRTQADKVEDALTRRIGCTQIITRKLENELKVILRQVVDAEASKECLKSAIRRMDTPMKVVQTRLDNRLVRPRVENCRDNVHHGLVAEVKSVEEAISALRAELKQAEHSELRLIQTRNSLEREIILKKKTLEVDIERTRVLRSYVPSTTALSGHQQ